MRHEIIRHCNPIEKLTYHKLSVPDKFGSLGFKLSTNTETHTLISEKIGEVFNSTLQTSNVGDDIKSWDPTKVDWALHPDGLGLLEGFQDSIGLTDDQLRASYEIYKTRGNSQSATVLVVLDKLRNMGDGRTNVVACSNGPGITVELSLLKRCNVDI